MHIHQYPNMRKNENDPEPLKASCSFVHALEPDADSSPMRLQFLHISHLHDGAAYVPEALLREVGAGDMFGKGAKVDSGILLRVPVRRCQKGGKVSSGHWKACFLLCKMATHAKNG